MEVDSEETAADLGGLGAGRLLPLRTQAWTCSASGDSWLIPGMDDTGSEKSLFGMDKWLYVEDNANCGPTAAIQKKVHFGPLPAGACVRVRAGPDAASMDLPILCRIPTLSELDLKAAAWVEARGYHAPTGPADYANIVRRVMIFLPHLVGGPSGRRSGGLAGETEDAGGV